ncbi:Hint domain-containing protein [Roseomonas rosulenta]|uniref:Hint domain-containing protein n=1 Tax=Roseomonas rosulenta TaxID=2748667 RepID=UPI0018DF9F4C|nr:Hint domain-containing protein [Roseomonas rosulenta]
MHGNQGAGRYKGSGTAHCQVPDVCAFTGLIPSCMAVTIEGERRLDKIYPGDILLVLGRIGYSPVQRVTEVGIDLSLRPEARPLLIRTGALDARSPIRDTVVAPQSLLCLDEVLVPAAALVNGRSILPAPVSGQVRYLHVEMCVHEMIIVDGIRVATEPAGDGLCRPLLEAPEALDRIRAYIAARIDRPEAPGSLGQPGIPGPRLGRGP